MSKMIVYRLRTGAAEYRTTPEKWEAMKVKHAGSMVFVREESVKEVRSPKPEGDGGVTKRVAPAPKAPRSRKADKQPKEVRTAKGPVDPVNNEEETNSANSGS